MKRIVLLLMVLLLSASTVLAQGGPCTADFNCDQNVDATDVDTFLSQFGRNPFNDPCPDCYDSPCACTICPSGEIDCGGTCIDPLKDREYCGATEGCTGGTVCADGEVCADGTCTLSCQSGLTDCYGLCVNNDTDEDYCGSCDKACSSGELCISGICDVPTPTCDGTLSTGGRWCNQGNGTVKDMTTGLVWLRKADWGSDYRFFISPAGATNAHDRAAQLWDGSPYEGAAGLSDGSVEGDWRLPTKTELYNLANGSEAVRSSSMQFFTGVLSTDYWSSTTSYTYGTVNAWCVPMNNGLENYCSKDSTNVYVWPVRGGH